jgi:hypothetical protein
MRVGRGGAGGELWFGSDEIAVTKAVCGKDKSYFLAMNLQYGGHLLLVL